MRTLSAKEWGRRYRAEWRARFAHLPKEQRAKLVRGCMGKAIYDSHDEALAVVERLPLRPGELLGAYDCPLCRGIHTGNRKYLYWKPARRLAQTQRCNGSQAE